MEWNYFAAKIPELVYQFQLVTVRKLWITNQIFKIKYYSFEKKQHT